jgi:peptidyl-prolyl cis-trans isomerase SurA
MIAYNRKNGLTFYLFLFLIAGSFGSSEGSAKILDRIVAVVNNDIITLYELNGAASPYFDRIKVMGHPPERERELIFRVREDILNQLIDERITDQEIKRAGITVSEAEIEKAIERIKESNYFTDEELRQALARQGVAFDDYRKKLRDQILRTKLVNLEVKSKIVITREEIRAYYEKHANRFGGEKRYHLRNILMKLPSFPGDDEKKEILQKMEAVLAELKKGEPFERLAGKFSEAPSASGGGDLGVFRMETLAPQLKEALEGVKAGEITPILLTDQGYQIFLVQEIIQADGKTLEAAAAEIEEKLYNEIVDTNFKTWLADLRKRSHIKIIR